MEEIKTLDQRKKDLLKMGKEEGFLTFEQLANVLKGLEMDAESLDDLYNLIYKDYMFYLYILVGSAGIIILSLIIIMIISSKNRKIRKLVINLEEKIKHKDKEIEKIKKIYYNNKHKKNKKNYKNNLNGDTSDIKLQLDNIHTEEKTSKKEDIDLNDTTETYNILKD